MAGVASTTAIIGEIESAFRAGSSEKRHQALMRVTDLFMDRADHCNDGESGLFDTVMSHLVTHVESRARVELSRRLAAISNAPRATVKRLARDDAVEIAGPVLTRSEQLSDDDLIEIAQTNSQAHLASIAQRRSLNEAVTDVLVERGDDQVTQNVADNDGAHFSRAGMANLVLRADGDSQLTESIARRPDISPVLFRQLMMQATDTVRARLLAAAAPHQRGAIKAIMDRLAAQIGARAPSPRDYAEARRVIAALSQDTSRMRSSIAEFADSHRLAEIVVALSVLSGLTVLEIEGLFTRHNEIGLTLLCKVIALDVNVAYAVAMTARVWPSSADACPYEDFRAEYEELSEASAARVIQFWRERQHTQQDSQTETA